MADLISTREAAVRLGVSELTLKGWRAAGRGPDYVKVGAAVRYDLRDLEDYVARQRRHPTRAARPTDLQT